MKFFLSAEDNSTRYSAYARELELELEPQYSEKIGVAAEVFH
jgi:hypothetical protein